MNQAFFSTIAGAFVALLGVLLTLRANQKTFETNLREERDKIARDREYTAKHKAFLAASEAITRFAIFFSSIPDRDLPKNGITPDEITEISVSLNALHFFCGIETIRCTASLNQTLGEAYSEAIKSKLPAIFLDEELKNLDIKISGLEKLTKQIQKEILAILNSDPSNPLLFSYNQQAAANHELLANSYGEKSELIKVKYAAIEKCRDAVIKDLPLVYEGVKELLLMARQELDFQIEAGEYSKIISEATIVAQASTKSFLNEVRAQVHEKYS